MKERCNMCQNIGEFIMKKDNFSIFQCTSCGLLFVHPQPSGESLKKDVYSGSYQSNKSTQLKNVEIDNKKKKIINYIKNKIPKGKKILDVGCSNGEFLYKLKGDGYDCFGVELNKRTHGIAKNNGLDVINSTLEEAKYDDIFFDVIFLGDLIEHVKDPVFFTRECHRILKKGGLIIISTPNIDCFWSESTLFLYKIFGIPWSSTTPPYHLFQFSINNLDLMMKNESFSKTDHWFNRPPTLKYELGQTHLWGNFKRNKNLKNTLKLFLGAILYPLLYFLDILITPLKKKDFGMVCVYKK